MSQQEILSLKNLIRFHLSFQFWKLPFRFLGFLFFFFFILKPRLAMVLKLFSLAGVSSLPQHSLWSLSWAGVASTFQLQFSCCWEINWFEAEAFSSVCFPSDLFLRVNEHVGSSVNRPWVYSTVLKASSPLLHLPPQASSTFPSNWKFHLT
jgi:hypothetical protein